jgi:cysteine-rich repeat protein
MSVRRIASLGGLASAILLFLACSGEKQLPPLIDDSEGEAGSASSGSGGASTRGTGGAATGGVAAGGADDGGEDGGAGGQDDSEDDEDEQPDSEPEARCDEPEQDGDGCLSDETCHDGRDNDGDALADCDDEDCSEACSASCVEPPELELPAELSGDTRGHASELHASCTPEGEPSGPEVVYQVTAGVAGKLQATLSTSKLLNVSLRPACGDDASELVCHSRVAVIDAEAGQSFFVVVDGFQSGDAGGYELDVVSRAADVCGDGYRDEGEACDDGDLDAGDGCNAACELEATEVEPNDTPAEADAATAPFYAEIAPQGDVDVVAVSIEQDGAELTAATLNFGDGACALGLLDSYIEILGPDQETVLADDDDGGDGLCARAVASGLTAGTYYVRVTASPLAEAGTETFPYRLGLSVGP